MKRSTPVAAVVFDFDGTLVDSNAVKREGYCAAFGGIPGSTAAVAAALRKYPDRDRRFIVAWVVERLRSSGTVDASTAGALGNRALRRYSRFCFEGVSRAPEFRGVAGTLPRLASRYRIAVNSGTQQRQLRRLVMAREWGRYCELVVGTPATKVENLERIRRRFQIRSDQIVLVGDGESDADAAGRFGCTFLRVAFDASPPPQERTRCVRRFSALPTAISSLRIRGDRHV